MSEHQRDWRQVKIGELLTEHSERSVSSNQHEVLSVTKDGIFSQRECFKKQIASEDNSGYKIVRRGDVVFSAMNLWMGSIDVVKDQAIGIVSPAYITMRPTEGLIDTGFLGYFLRGDEMRKKYVQNSQQGASIVRRNLNKDDLLDDEVLLPPLPEQKKIAEILSGIDNTTKAFFRKKKKNDLILRQVIIDATTPNYGSSWHESTIGDVVEFQGGAQPPRATFKFAPEAGYIRMLQIRDYKSDARATYIPLDLCKRFCDREDVMIGRYGPPNFQILRGKEGSYNVALIKAMPKDSVVLSKDYLYRFLQRGDLFVLMDTLSQRTSGQQGLDMDALKGFPMFIPDLATQEYICRSISAIESISLGLNARVQSLNLLKSGISGQLLSGRKRVSV